MLVGVVFLLIESKRVRDYDIWRSRVRVLQENLFATASIPAGASNTGIGANS